MSAIMENYYRELLSEVKGMNWKALWMNLFGTCEWLGLNMGFWVSMAAVLLIVIIMNAVFWGIKSKK